MDYEFNSTKQLSHIHYTHGIQLCIEIRSLLLPTNLFLCEKDVHFDGVFIQFWDNFHLYVNGRFILEEIGEMLIGKSMLMRGLH